MGVQLEVIVRWSARVVGVAVAAYFILVLIQEAMVAAARGDMLSQLTVPDYLALSLVWLAGIGLLLGVKWPFFGGFLSLVGSSAALMLLLLRSAPIHPALVLVLAAGALYVLDGALARASAEPRK